MSFCLFVFLCASHCPSFILLDVGSRILTLHVFHSCFSLKLVCAITIDFFSSSLSLFFQSSAIPLNELHFWFENCTFQSSKWFFIVFFLCWDSSSILRCNIQCVEHFYLPKLPFRPFVVDPVLSTGLQVTIALLSFATACLCFNFT